MPCALTMVTRPPTCSLRNFQMLASGRTAF
jgi:hypothetical protein